MLLFINSRGQLRGCFQTPGSGNLEWPAHRRITVRSRYEDLQMRQDIISASQIILIVPKGFSDLLDFSLDIERRQTASLSPEILTLFSRLAIWNCVKGSSPTTLAKVRFYSAGKFVSLIQLSRVFPQTVDSEPIDILPQEVRNNLNTPIRTRNRSSTQPLVLQNHQLVSDGRPSTR